MFLQGHIHVYITHAIIFSNQTLATITGRQFLTLSVFHQNHVITVRVWSRNNSILPKITVDIIFFISPTVSVIHFCAILIINVTLTCESTEHLVFILLTLCVTCVFIIMFCASYKLSGHHNHNDSICIWVVSLRGAVHCQALIAGRRQCSQILCTAQS